MFYQRTMLDYYWSHPKAKPFNHPEIPRNLKVKTLVDWAEYQHLDSMWFLTDPDEIYYRGAQVLFDGDRYVIVASDHDKFDEYLEDELVHLTQTRKESLRHDLTGAHGELSRRLAEEILQKQLPDLEIPRSYAHTVLESEFGCNAQELDHMSEWEKAVLCRKCIRAAFSKWSFIVNA